MEIKAYWDGAPVYPGNASSAEAEEAIHLLQNVLAILRGHRWIYQSSHWQTLGVPFYGNHLLFQRLYESIVEEVDALAEKMVAFYGIEAVDSVVLIKLASWWVQRWHDSAECNMQRGIQAEEDFQKVLRHAYNRIKELDLMSLGLDDYMMATANKHETNTYLLQQTLLQLDKVLGGDRKEQGKTATVPDLTTPALGGWSLEMTPLEKTWSGFSSFTPIRRAEADDELGDDDSNKMWDPGPSPDGFGPFNPNAPGAAPPPVTVDDNIDREATMGLVDFRGWTMVDDAGED